MAKTTIQDSTLVQCIITGDEAALASLYDRYSGMLFTMLLRILNDSGAAEEVLQDLFLQVWRGAGRFDASRGTLAAWLLIMGRSRALSRLRVRRRWEVRERPEELYFQTVPSPLDLEDEVMRMQLNQRLREAIATLPVKQREAVELAYFEGMSQAEIAVRTGSPLGTVKSRVRCAMRALRELFADELILRC